MPCVFRRGLWTALSLELASVAVLLPAGLVARPAWAVQETPPAAAQPNIVPTPSPSDDAPVTADPSATTPPPPVQVPTHVTPGGTPAVAPDPATGATDPANSRTEPPAPEPVPTAPPPAEHGVAPDLLATEPAEASPPPPVVTPSAEDEADAYELALARELNQRFRPASNPGRLNVVARLMFANAGGSGKVGGRLGGLQADVGQSWNFIGYAATANLWLGRVYLEGYRGEVNVLVGGGPTLSLGRRALLGRGYLDVRVGYDFLYGNIEERETMAQDVMAKELGNFVAPHGPRVQLNLGLLAQNAVGRRFFQGFGATMGYQGLVGSFAGEMPYTHMLTIGLSYWLG